MWASYDFTDYMHNIIFLLFCPKVAKKLQNVLSLWIGKIYQSGIVE